MDRGIPTIVTNDGALPEIADKNSSIIINKNANIAEQICFAIIDFTTGKRKLNGMEACSQKSFAEFSIDNYVEKFREYIGD